MYNISTITSGKCRYALSGKSEQPIQERLLKQKFSICEGQLTVCLSLLVDMKKRGRQFNMQINIFYECIIQCVKHFSGKPTCTGIASGVKLAIPYFSFPKLLLILYELLI